MTQDAARARAVGDLPLSTRARNALARARIKTVGDLETALNGSWPGKLRGLGKPTLEEIATIAEPYLKNLPAASPAAKPEANHVANGDGGIAPLLGLVLPTKLHQRAAATPMGSFDHVFKTRARNVLKALRCLTLMDVLNLTEAKLLSAKNSGVKTLREVKSTLRDVLAEMAAMEPITEDEPSTAIHGKLAEWHARRQAKPTTAHEDWTAAFKPTAAGMRKFVNALLGSVDKRAGQIVMDRHGLWDGDGDTLEDIAGKLGITRERVRQLQFRAEQKIRRMAAAAIPRMIPRFADVVVGAYLKSHHGLATEQELLRDGLSAWGDQEARLCFEFISAMHEETPRLLLSAYQRNDEEILFQNAAAHEKYSAGVTGIKTALAAKGKPVNPNEVAALSAQALPGISPGFIKRCAEVSKEIGLDASGHVGLRKWAFFDPQRIPDMAVRALMELGQPAHFTHVVETMNSLFPDRAPFSVNSVGNILCQDSRFVFVRRGHYGLANWGLQRPPYIKDFLAQTLKARGGAAKIEDLVAEGKAKYSFRDASLRMTLGMNPRVFKVLGDGTCRLVD